MCSTSVTVWPLYPDKNIILTAPGISSFSVTTLLCSTFQQFHTNSLMFETVWLAENDCEAGRVWCWIISWWLWIICPLSREMDLFHIIWTHLDQLTATTNDDCDLSVDCQVMLLQSYCRVFHLNSITTRVTIRVRAKPKVLMSKKQSTPSSCAAVSEWGCCSAAWVCSAWCGRGPSIAQSSGATVATRRSYWQHWSNTGVTLVTLTTMWSKENMNN